MEQDGIFKSPARQSLSLRACGLTEAGPNLDSSLVGTVKWFSSRTWAGSEES